MSEKRCVYVLVWHEPWEGYDIKAIYSTPEKAAAALRAESDSEYQVLVFELDRDNGEIGELYRRGDAEWVVQLYPKPQQEVGK